MQTWYVINNISPDETEVRIYESIGMFGISARQFADDLDQISAKKISLRINSPGGEVFDASAIANTLRAHPADITVHIDGLAASAASIVAMAGDEIRMADNAYFMIHNASGGVFGGAEDMRKYADVLEKINDTIASTYQGKAGKTRKYWRGKMADETWFTASEAKDEGLIDFVDESASTPSNQFDFKFFNNAPEAARHLWEKQTSAPEPAPSGVDPVVQTQEPIMATATQDPPAQTPAAGSGNSPQGNLPQQEINRLNQQTLQTHSENGRKLGFQEGKQAELTRMKALIEAAPGRPDLVIDAFVTGQDPAAVALAFKAAQFASSQAANAIQEKDVEIARLNSLIATGGYPNGVQQSFSTEKSDEPVSGLEPEAQAKMEWDSNPNLRAQYGGKEKVYLAFRVNQLKGNIQIKK